MKKRILFVDDEPLALRALERLLHPMRHSWEMEFVDSGEKALERMAKVPFEVLVSDMRMPGMNGAQLLNEVLQRHPSVVRLVLSGYADYDLILKSVGSTHQYLSKPCDVETLKAAIHRATVLNDSFESETLRTVISSCERLPSVPTLYFEIIKALNDPTASLDSISNIIAGDAAMTALILKLVNSAFFGLSRQMASPHDAVTHLGMDTIKSLALVAHMFSQYEGAKIDGFSIETLWRHCLGVGRAAAAVSRHEKLDRKLIDESYTAGLLHDVGKLILAANLGKDYRRAIHLAQDEKIVMTMAERKVFGTDHACVGGYLLGLWGLPVPIVEAVTWHHRPESGMRNVLTPLTIVHVSNVLVSLKDPVIPGVPASEVDSNYLAALGLQDRLQVWRSVQNSEPADL